MEITAVVAYHMLKLDKQNSNNRSNSSYQWFHWFLIISINLKAKTTLAILKVTHLCLPSTLVRIRTSQIIKISIKFIVSHQIITAIINKDTTHLLLLVDKLVSRIIYVNSLFQMKTIAIIILIILVINNKRIVISVQTGTPVLDHFLCL